ncbi:MAG TPA: shikimate kinase [Pyrinomonadaceae bacterium]
MKSSKTIVITGFMGCGKSEVASRLAVCLNQSFTDLDELITTTTGRTPAQLIREEGERAFRAIETEVLRELLDNEPGVVALGGGAWIEEVNRDLIQTKEAVTVWLDTPFELCWERIAASSEDRPLGSTREQASARYEQRRPVYQLANITITVDAQDDPELIGQRIIDLLG